MIPSSMYKLINGFKCFFCDASANVADVARKKKPANTDTKLKSQQVLMVRCVRAALRIANIHDSSKKSGVWFVIYTLADTQSVLSMRLIEVEIYATAKKWMVHKRLSPLNLKSTEHWNCLSSRDYLSTIDSAHKWFLRTPHVLLLLLLLLRLLMVFSKCAAVLQSHFLCFSHLLIFRCCLFIVCNAILSTMCSG